MFCLSEGQILPQITAKIKRCQPGESATSMNNNTVLVQNSSKATLTQLETLSGPAIIPRQQ